MRDAEMLSGPSHSNLPSPCQYALDEVQLNVTKTSHSKACALPPVASLQSQLQHRKPTASRPRCIEQGKLVTILAPCCGRRQAANPYTNQFTVNFTQNCLDWR